jgi:hypothetical protein
LYWHPYIKSVGGEYSWFPIVALRTSNHVIVGLEQNGKIFEFITSQSHHTKTYQCHPNLPELLQTWLGWMYGNHHYFFLTFYFLFPNRPLSKDLHDLALWWGCDPEKKIKHLDQIKTFI